jgi:hypothetical protein
MGDEGFGGHVSGSISEILALRNQTEQVLARHREETRALHARLDALTAHAPGAKSSDVASRRSFSRRRMLQWTGAGLGGGVALAVTGPLAISPPLAAAAPLLASKSKPTGPVIYVAGPTGNPASDMPAILTALNQAQSGMTVVFQCSPTAAYAIDQELPVRRGVRLTGKGAASELAPGSGAIGSMPTLQQVANTPLKCIVGSAGYLAGLYGPHNPGKYDFLGLYNDGTPVTSVEAAIEVDHLAFDGQNGGTGSGNTQGHGVVLYTYGAKLHDCVFLNIANTAIYVADQNYRGQVPGNEQHENRVEDNLVINPGWWGIFVDNVILPGRGGATDGHILNNVVFSPSQQQRAAGPLIDPTTKAPYEALHMSNAAGWWVVNNHFVACPGNGAYFNTTGGLHLIDNVLDGFGCYPKAHKSYVGFNVTTAGQTKLHPGRIIGNLAAAYESTNPFSPAVKAAKTNTYEYFKLAMQTDPGRETQPVYFAYPTHADNVAHQASGFPAPITDATIPPSNLLKVLVANGAASNVETGMVISDSAGSIATGTTVASVKPGIGTNPDTINLSQPASSTETNDTVTFSGPTSVAWTYQNTMSVMNYGLANMVVTRTNEMATGSINGAPVFQNPPQAGFPTPSITLIDPADFAGGAQVTGAPSASQIIVATAPGTTNSYPAALWKTPEMGSNPAVGSAGGILAGAFPDPTFSSEMVTTFTTSGTYSVPPWATSGRITCVGAGGGGGGGTGGASGQVGGSGGAAGATVEQFVNLEGITALDVSVGSGGNGGGGNRGGSPGADGEAGSGTTVQGATIAIAAGGGSGGLGALIGATPMEGAAYGAPQGAGSPVPLASGGGPSGQPGGNPFASSPGGAGGGGTASALVGGTGGGAGTSGAGGGSGIAGGSSSSLGGSGASATDPGAPGGGGGAGAGAAATGGGGGSGGDGLVVIQILG